jgi:hypothetical protein
MSSRSRLFAYGLVIALAGCGGAEAGAPPNRSPQVAPTQDEPEPRTVEDAQEQIARLRARLDADNKKRDEAPSTPPKSEAPREERADTCVDPCRALLSMKRAVDALCRMTGDGDARCADAKKTLSDSTARISPCRC